ncbi:MAG: hypothetical protein ABSG41_15015 [Bryobacteraceae bacterium]
MVLTVSENGKGTSEQYQQCISDDSPLINRRFLFTLFAGILLIPACEFGGDLISEGLNIYGRLLIIGGFGLFWGGLALIFLSGFRWTLGWWL